MPDYDAIIIAVPHASYSDCDDTYFASITKKDALVFDLKGTYRNLIKSRVYKSL